MTSFNALAAVFALVVLLRHARAALAFLQPLRRDPGAAEGEAADPTSTRLAGLVPLLASLAALAVLVAAVKGLVAGPPPPGATP